MLISGDRCSPQPSLGRKLLLEANGGDSRIHGCSRGCLSWGHLNHVAWGSGNNTEEGEKESKKVCESLTSGPRHSHCKPNLTAAGVACTVATKIGPINSQPWIWKELPAELWRLVGSGGGADIFFSCAPTGKPPGSSSSLYCSGISFVLQEIKFAWKSKK